MSLKITPNSILRLGRDGLVTGIGGVSFPYTPDFDLDASKLSLANNDPVASWTDQASGGNHAVQADPAKQPVYIAASSLLRNLPVVRFNGTSHMLSTPSFLDATYNKALTVFYVGYSNYGSSGFGIAVSQGTRFLIGKEQYQTYAKVTGPNKTLKIGYSKLTSYASSVAIWIDGISYDGTRFLSMTNGEYLTSATTVDLALSGGLTIGAYNTGLLYWAGDLARVLVWKRAMTTPEVQQVAAVLAAQYSTPICTRRLIFEGDSMTAGYWATAPGGSYPEQLKVGLGSKSGDYIFNIGISGRRLAAEIPSATSGVDLLFLPGSTETYTNWIGTNDLHAELKSGTDLVADYKTYMAGRKTAGAQNLIVCTLLPASDTGIPASFETERQAFNASLRADFSVATSDARVWLPGPGITYANVLADYAADSRIGDAGDELNTTYYYDKLHMVDAGYAIIAEINQLAHSALGIT